MPVIVTHRVIFSCRQVQTSNVLIIQQVIMIIWSLMVCIDTTHLLSRFCHALLRCSRHPVLVSSWKIQALLRRASMLCHRSRECPAYRLNSESSWRSSYWSYSWYQLGFHAISVVMLLLLRQWILCLNQSTTVNTGTSKSLNMMLTKKGVLFRKIIWRRTTDRLICRSDKPVHHNINFHLRIDSWISCLAE